MVYHMIQEIHFSVVQKVGYHHHSFVSHCSSLRPGSWHMSLSSIDPWLFVESYGCQLRELWVWMVLVAQPPTNQNLAQMTTGQAVQICSAYVASIFQPLRCCLVLSSLPQTRSQEVRLSWRGCSSLYEPFREFGCWYCLIHDVFSCTILFYPGWDYDPPFLWGEVQSLRVS